MIVDHSFVIIPLHNINAVHSTCVLLKVLLNHKLSLIIGAGISGIYFNLAVMYNIQYIDRKCQRSCITTHISMNNVQSTELETVVGFHWTHHLNCYPYMVINISLDRILLVKQSLLCGKSWFAI